MTTKEVADRLVSLCRTGQWGQAQDELYADHAVSIEPEGSPWGVAEGLAAIKEKGKKWAEMVEEMHGGEVGDPVVAGNHFCCSMSNDATFKGMGRMQFEELCVYEVADGKIVSERFFFEPAPPPQS